MFATKSFKSMELHASWQDSLAGSSDTLY